MRKLKEKTIENKLVKYYRSNNYKVVSQVSFSQKRIDIVLRNRDTICAIEVKLDDWKTALRQANLNKIGCNQSYVAIWHKFSHRAIKYEARFKALGIGLIVINEKYEPEIQIPSIDSYPTNTLAYSYIAARV